MAREKRNSWLVSGILAVALCAVLYASLKPLLPPCRITRKDFDSIRNGMKPIDVERILGKPTDRTPPTKNMPAIFKTTGAIVVDKWALMKDQCLIYVGYDESGGVVAKVFIPAPEYGEHFFF